MIRILLLGACLLVTMLPAQAQTSTGPVQGVVKGTKTIGQGVVQGTGQAGRGVAQGATGVAKGAGQATVGVAKGTGTAAAKTGKGLWCIVTLGYGC
jgi:hypothetical protein